MKISKKRLAFYLSFLVLILSNGAYAQGNSKEKMSQLQFMVGDWLGASKSIKNGEVVSEVPAYQKIKYDLNKSIITIDLRSSTLQLHTVIYFDQKDQTYYYTAYSERGSGRSPAELKGNQLIVHSNDTTRYIFGRTVDGNFQEYGEKLVDGKWVKYFEDTFQNTEE